MQLMLLFEMSLQKTTNQTMNMTRSLNHPISSAPAFAPQNSHFWERRFHPLSESNRIRTHNHLVH